MSISSETKPPKVRKSLEPAILSQRDAPPMVFEGFEENSDKLEEIQKIAQRHATLIPYWAQVVYIQFEDRNHVEGGCICEVCAQYDYRRVYVTIYPLFWTQSASEKDECFRHELVHPLIVPIQEFVERVMNRLDEPLRSAMKDEMRLHVESTVQDISHVLARLQPPGPARQTPTLNDNGKRTDG